MSTCRTSEGKPKVRFNTRADARSRIKVFREAGEDVSELQPYHCQVCDYFHLGHYPKDPEARKGMKQRRLAAKVSA